MGYRREDFVEKVDENLICLICHEVLADPQQCKEGHIFCKECIKAWLNHKCRCPMDNTALRFESLMPSVFAKNIIQNLKVFCHQPGNDAQVADTAEKCNWSGKLLALADHRKTCPFQQIQCSNVNCNTKMQRRELEDHDKICKYKELECEKCKKVLLRHMLIVHKNNDCPEEMVPCPNRCTSPQNGQISKIKRIDLGWHMENECAKTILDCPFKDQGCSVQVERQHVDKHAQDNMAAHMMLLAKQCSLLTKDNKQLRQELNQLKVSSGDYGVVATALYDYQASKTLVALSCAAFI
ncbi:TNF receptor-associated factor 5-like [Actinia tenebrosa]|uniref:TNF receptor-associated factor 5-like n=1 Tax=Actinia tenebrosa TaxID=6105 RepID=A0A6P8H9S5_ACTTE|nr:TNF receptor-associated factor 5-like [Actinia tenebrosa]